MSISDNLEGSEIAIVGMTARFPGARNLDEFWQNLRDGVESVRPLSDQELEDLGVDVTLRGHPNYVKLTAVLDDVELFDAAFFGYTPRDAELMDPQQRIFLECAWQAFERAGYDPETYRGNVGVFAGTMMSTYLLHNLFPNRQLFSTIDPVQVTVGNDESFLATRVSYNLNLKGPSCAIQTACSTSLVAIHLACQSLLSEECDMALAGGVSVNVKHLEGYYYAEGGMDSPDGHCRAFDARAAGTIFGSGIGIVVLKRLADAMAQGDHIHAIIRGSAVNNDGAVKVGYTAPGVEGQTAVIAEALTVAGVPAATIDYVETHGTATRMGDPIEIKALTKAFSTDARNCCAIGSVKTNVGHLGAAAGAAGLIKTVLALENELIPPSLHFEQPNPEINFADSPFFVNTELAEWRADGSPRRAGVSSFGLGGTNAHIVLEQAPTVEASGPSRPYHLLLLSARTSTALDAATSNLLGYLDQHPDLNLADVAHTLQVGRRAFNYRRMAVCRDLDDAVNVLKACDPQRVYAGVSEFQGRPVAFLFPGMGDQYVNMGLELYQVEPTFREHVDRCAEFLKPLLGLDLRDVLYPGGTQAQDADRGSPTSVGSPQEINLRKLLRSDDEQPDSAAQKLNQTHLAHPIIFVVEYALARLWMEWGIRPQAMIGHSIGEYVAACLAGVFSLEDGLFLITKRAQMIHELPGGAMLAVLLSEEQVRPCLDERLSLSAVNAPLSCVVSGPTDGVADLERRLIEKRIASQRVQTNHAFHSAMMNPIVEPFAELFERVTLHPPEIPLLSNVTGTWITAEEATDPDYWTRHLCQTVRFADGIEQLLKEAEQILLEVGPGLTLSTLAIQRPDKDAEQIVLTSLRHPHDPQSDVAFLLTTLGRLWLAGASVNGPGFYAHEHRLRLPLPTYPFERQHYWVERQASSEAAPGWLVQGKNPNIADWFFIPTWRQTPQLPPVPSFEETRCWLVFVDRVGLGVTLVERLRALDQTVVTVVEGEAFGRGEDGTYTLNPKNEGDYVALVRQLKIEGQLPNLVAHSWSVTTGDEPSNLDFFNHMQDLGYYSLLFLAQALAQEAPGQAVHVGVITNKVHEVSGSDGIFPEKVTLLGLCKVIPQEQENLSCACIDVMLPEAGTRQRQQLVDRLVGELTTEDADEIVLAYRRGRRWVQHYTPAPLQEDDAVKRPLREGGVYWIIGGLGNIGYLVGQYLVQTVKARLVLSSRSGLPPRSRWTDVLAASDENDATARKIRHVQALEDLGAEVMVAHADVTDEAQMHDLVTQIHDRFGQLNGVLHAAGVTSGPSVHRPLTEIGRTESEAQFRPKVNGLYVLEKVLADREIDFCLLFSSSSAVLGGLGYTAYAAANAFLDAFAVSRNQESITPWISADWDPWPMAMEQDQGAQTSYDQYGMRPEESQEAFRRVACLADEGHVLVMTGDLSARLDLWVRRVASKKRQPVTLHERPALAHEYVAPRNEREKIVADVWTKVLGIEKIGVHDNFFELGGHSLLLTQILGELRQALKIELPVRSLFEHTTVAGLAQFIESGGGQVSEGAEKPISDRIRSAFPTERQDLVRTYLQQKIALALGLAIDQLPEDGRLTTFDPEVFSVDLMVHLKQDFQIQVFPQEIRRIPSVEAMTQFVMNELDRVADLTRLATTKPLSAYKLQPYRKQSAGQPIQPVQKNEPMVFVACSPRSGSTIFRVMLAGHPDLFCPPELYLLHFETMQEWDQNVGFGEVFAWNRQGLEWALGELMGGEPEASQTYIDELVRQNESVYSVYGQLQELADGHLLVDKTPTYAVDMEALERAERLFEAPKYVHLVRHPYTVIDSLLRVRLDKLLGPNLFKEPDVDPYVVAETVWALSNRNMLRFLERIEPERQCLVRYEDLVSDPASVMTDLCRFLDIPFDEAVLNPYDNPLGRMVGGIGDPNIFRHDRIDPERGEAWKKIRLPRYLDESTKQLALQFGYELPGDVQANDQLLSAPDQPGKDQLPIELSELSDEQVDRMLNELLKKGM